MIKEDATAIRKMPMMLYSKYKSLKCTGCASLRYSLSVRITFQKWRIFPLRET